MSLTSKNFLCCQFSMIDIIFYPVCMFQFFFTLLAFRLITIPSVTRSASNPHSTFHKSYFGPDITFYVSVNQKEKKTKHFLVFFSSYFNSCLTLTVLTVPFLQILCGIFIWTFLILFILPQGHNSVSFNPFKLETQILYSFTFFFFFFY